MWPRRPASSSEPLGRHLFLEGPEKVTGTTSDERTSRKIVWPVSVLVSVAGRQPRYAGVRSGPLTGGFAWRRTSADVGADGS